MSDLVCPKCRTHIDPEERCESNGLGQCMERQGHDGWHWTDMGRGDGGVTIWTGAYVKHSCAGRIDLSHWCQKPPGHDGAHNDGKGLTFGDPELVEEAGE